MPLLPSAFAASAIDSVGSAASSLVMVPVADPSRSVAPTGVPSVTVKVSVGSTVVSPTIGMLMVWVVVVPVKLSDPLVTAVKSPGATAVPLLVE